MSVNEILKVSEDIGAYYENNLEAELKEQLKNIINELEKYIEKKCISDGKVLSNSVYKSILPFSYKTRIKSRISIEEKIIRNDIKFGSINKAEILRKFDDLIGITILTTTIGYQELGYTYLKSYIEENKEITVVSGLDKKRSIFGNERIEYYHLKIIYKGYPVEIQIKSIFLSAFADIEHSLFYKDHSIHEFKSYNKKIMHSLAPILIDLEEILHGIYTHDKTYLESEVLKRTIYDYLETHKTQILGIDESENRLNFILKKATELLYIYFQEKEFDNNRSIQGMTESKDLKIIQYLYGDSLQYMIISKILDDESEFFSSKLRNELKSDESYEGKLNLMKSYLDTFINSIVNLSENNIFNSVQLEKDIQLKKAFDLFMSRLESFEEEFPDIDVQNEILEFIYACLIIPYLVKDKNELHKNIGNQVEEYFKSQEEKDIINNYEVSEKVLGFILEGWNDK